MSLKGRGSGVTSVVILVTRGDGRRARARCIPSESPRGPGGYSRPAPVRTPRNTVSAMKKSTPSEGHIGHELRVGDESL